MIPRTLRLQLVTAAVASACASAAVAQGARATAITNARIVTMEGKTIEMGMVLIRHGKIQEVGKNVKVPPGSKIVDAKGGTVMPGLVSAYSRAGIPGRSASPQRTNARRRGRGRRGGFRGGRSSGPGRNAAATKVAAAIYARQEIFHELLEAGITTLALAPTGTGYPGRAALLDLTGKTRESLVVDDSAYIAVNPANNTKAKKLIKDTFEKAKKLVEERKKSAAPAKPKTTAAKPAKEGEPSAKTGAGKKGTGTPPKPGPKPKPTPKPPPKPTPEPKPKPTPKPTPKPAPKPADGKSGKSASKTKPPQKKKKKKKKTDPNLEVIADLLEGKTRAFIGLDSATDVLHYLDAVGDTRFPANILMVNPSRNAGSLDQAIDEVKSLKAPVLMPAKLGSIPYTDHITNPAADLHDAGIKIGFLVDDSRLASRSLFSNLMTLVRHGLDADVALAGVTRVPAEMLGVADKVGSIKKGKEANLLLFDGDPLVPTTTLQTVWFKGEVVEKEERQ